MIRDKYGCVWVGHADLARDWGGDVTAVVWGEGDMLGSYHSTRALAEEGTSHAWTRRHPSRLG